MELAEPRALPPATGQRDSPQPPTPLTSRPLWPRSPRSVTSPVPASLRATEPRGCCCCLRSSAAPPKRAPGRAEEGLIPREGSRHPPPPPALLQVAVPVRSPGGHLRVGDLGGFLGQAAALGRDQVVVLGHVLVRVVQAAGAGPGWGPRGQARGVISVCPLCSGTTPAHPRAQGTPLSRANPLPKTLIPVTEQGWTQ